MSMGRKKWWVKRVGQADVRQAVVGRSQLFASASWQELNSGWIGVTHYGRERHHYH